MTKVLREILRSPLSPLVDRVRQCPRARGIRQAAALCRVADALRLHRERDWKRRSDRLYRRIAHLSLEQRSGEQRCEGSSPVAHDLALSAHRALHHARRPYRLAWAKLILAAAAVAVGATVLLLLGALLVPSLRARLFPVDLAADASWTASSSDFGKPSSGKGPSSDGEVFFHTAVVANPTLDLDLGAERTLRKLVVENRSNCCFERALPLNVEILRDDQWQLIAQRRTTFRTWTYDLGAVRARHLRLRRPGSGYFHLKRISVYGE